MFTCGFTAYLGKVRFEEQDLVFRASLFFRRKGPSIGASHQNVKNIRQADSLRYASSRNGKRGSRFPDFAKSEG